MLLPYLPAVSHFSKRNSLHKEYSDFAAELEDSMAVRKCNSTVGASCQGEVFSSLRDGHCHVTDPFISKYPLQLRGPTAHSGDQRRTAKSCSV